MREMLYCRRIGTTRGAAGGARPCKQQQAREKMLQPLRQCRPGRGSHRNWHSCPATDQVTCDRGCSRAQFCDRHFGVCIALRQEGQFCRKDSQCGRGLNCMFGKCHWIVPEGQEGARCKLDKDCGPAMCCARHHGELVCKRRLTQGESCYVPDGGLAFSINQVCPCEDGLSCRTQDPARDSELDYWRETGPWQCQGPSP